jgi:uncharacterized Zn-binding protein involved in type VI secretion
MSIPPKAARVTDSHSCPKDPGPGGYQPATKIIPKGEPTVLICKKPAARVTDQLNCGAKIISGEATVLIGGLPAARVADKSDHGGCIASGCPTVLIGKPAPGKCLQSDSSFVKEEATPSDASLNSIETGGDAISPKTNLVANKSSPLPLNENLLNLLGGKDALDLIGGADTLNMVKQSLDIVGNTLTKMGKDNPLNKISGGLNLLNGNALTQLGGAMSLMGEEKVGGAMSLLGAAVGGGNPASLLAGASHLIGKDKLGSILNLAGNPTNLVAEVMKITGKEKPKPAPIETQHDNDPFM